MRPTQRRVLSAVTLLLLTALGGRSAGAQTTVRVSVASDGTEGNDVSLGSALSADGRFVAFDSAATDLVAGDTNGVSDVFVHDRQTGTTERVSVASDGAQGNGRSGLVTFAFPPALSADGRFVAFVSAAANLVASDTNGATDVFVHDRQTGTTERVSVASDGTESNAANVGPSLSADGRFVAAPALSADGRFVAFDSDAANLVAGDTNGATDVFVHDRQTGTTERVSVASGGSQGNGSNAGPVLSADGRFVAFHGTASNLVGGDTNGTTDVFVHDRQTGTTERMSVASGGTQGNGPSSGAALSADGSLVAFHGTATNLVAGDANGAYDVFVHDRAVSTTTTSPTQPATTSTSSTTTTVSTMPTTTLSTVTTTTATTAPTTTVTTAPTTTVTTASTTTVTTAPTTTVTTASTTTVTMAPTTTVTTAPTTTVTTAPTNTVTPPPTTPGPPAPTTPAPPAATHPA